MKEEELYQKAIHWAKTKGYSAIKANVEGFEAPTSFRKKDNDDTFTPDITAKKLGTKNYIEISVKSEEVKRDISKWKLLSSLAAARGGKLFLLAPRGHKAYTEKIVTENNLAAQVVSI
jgi:hypothetical protein